MMLLLPILLTVGFICGSEYQRKEIEDAFLDACRDNSVRRINLFINDTRLTDDLILTCLDMQKDRLDSYLTVLSSERFLLSKAKRYPLYHNASSSQIDKELKMLLNLYTKQFKKLVVQIQENAYLLEEGRVGQVRVFRAALHNEGNRQYAVSLTLFADYCALHGLPNILTLLRDSADIAFDVAGVPPDEAPLAFFKACEEGDLDMFLNLIVSGLVIDPSMKYDRCAKLTSSPEIMEALLYYPGTDAEGILRMAVIKGRYKIVMSILEHRHFSPTKQVIGECKLLAFAQNQSDIQELLDEYMTLMFKYSSSSSGSSDSSSSSGSSSSSSTTESLGEIKVHRNSAEDVEDAKFALMQSGLISPSDDLLDRYVLQPDPICSGSFGQVFRAFDTSQDNEVAIKHINLNTQHNLSHLIREISILSQLDHVNVVKYIASYLIGENLWIVMELMAGDARMLDWKRVDETSLGAITKQLVTGLVYLHASDIIHRDLKPENILFNSDGVFKLADFGLSIKLEPGNPLAVSRVGTKEFLAPELVRGKFYSNKVDIWALGVTIYELACGRTLYTRDKMVEFVKYVNEHEVGIPDHLGPYLKDFLGKCLKARPSERPTAEELLKHPFLIDVGVDLGLVVSQGSGATPSQSKSLLTSSSSEQSSKSTGSPSESSTESSEGSYWSSSYSSRRTSSEESEEEYHSTPRPKPKHNFDFLETGFNQYDILQNIHLSDSLEDYQESNLADFSRDSSDHEKVGHPEALESDKEELILLAESLAKESIAEKKREALELLDELNQQHQMEDQEEERRGRSRTRRASRGRKQEILYPFAPDYHQ